MSDQIQAGTTLSLEDLFLSQEFGKPRAKPVVTEVEPMLFGGAPLRGPLVPLAGTSVSGLVGHATSTHMRRNRTLFAAASGVAAALLVAVGVVAQPPGPTTRGPATNFAIGGIGGINGFGGGQTGTNPTGTTTPGSTAGNGSAGTSIGLANFTVGGTGGHKTVTPIVVGCTGCGTQPILIVPVTTSPGSSPTPAGSSGGLLAPLTQLLGHTVTTVGATASTAATGLTVTLPGLSPVTGLVGSLGGTLAHLGTDLSGTTV